MFINNEKVYMSQRQITIHFWECSISLGMNCLLHSAIFTRDQARKATDLQPKMTEEASRMISKLKVIFEETYLVDFYKYFRSLYDT